MKRLENTHGWVLSGTVLVTYLALAQYVIWLNDPVRHGAGFWPANGVTLAALLLVPRRRWGWIVAAVVVAELAGDTLLHGYPLVPSLWWTAANVVEPLLAALILGGPGVPTSVRVRHIGAFIVGAALVAPALAAVVGSTGTVAEYGVPPLSTWLKFAVGDGIGVMVVTPLVLALARPQQRPQRRLIEVGALVALLSALGAAQFVDWSGDLEVLMPFLAMPVVVWAALRLGFVGAALSGFAIAQACNAANALGRGAFALDVPDGHAITLLQIFIGITLGTGLIVAAMSEDIMKRADVEQLLAAQARSDALTGLPNRKALMERLRMVLSADGGAHVVSVFFVDLDDFKVINDTRGHAAGDRVLGVIGHRLAAATRTGDLVARFGGDEFVVLCVDLDDEDGTDVISARLLDAASAPIEYEGELLYVGASVGVVTALTGTDPDVVLRQSDTAMYRAKSLGKGRAQRFDHRHVA